MQVLGNILKGFVNPFVITVFCGIVCLFPIFAGFELSVNPDSPMALGFKSYQYQFSIVSGIAVGFPMLLDYAFDRFGANHLKRAKGLIPRRDVTLALIVPNIILIAYVLPFEKYSYLPCITKARECFYSYSFFLYASKHCRPIWTKRTVSIPLVAFGISNVIGCINPFYHGAFNPILNILQPLFAFITVITFARLYYLYSTHIREDKTLNSKENHYQNSIYINSAFTLGIFFLILNYALDHDTWETTGYLYLTLYTYSLCIFATVVTVLNGRIVRIEAAQTQQTLEVRKMFVRYISHEIRTPLNTVFLGLKLLEQELRQCHANDKTMTTIKEIRVSCNVSLDILNDLLTFDKLESGILKLETQFLSPFHFIQETINPFNIQAREADVNIEYSSFDDLQVMFLGVSLKADPHKLSQVIRNLVSNALKFSPRGSTVTIKLIRVKRVISETDRDRDRDRDRDAPPIDGFETDEDGNVCESYDTFRLQVIDTGAGISQENQARLFKEIVQFNPGKLQAGGGSGLGLYITKGIVDLHKGAISVYSQGEGFGCTFTLELPLYTTVTTLASVSINTDVAVIGRNINPTATEMESNLSSHHGELRDRDKKKVNVLIVDDSSMNRKMMMRLMESRCKVCVEAINGQEAVDAVKEGMEAGKTMALDVIMMDHMMPVMDGPSACKIIRSMGYKGLIIGITGNVLSCDIDVFMSAGADAVLTKPLDVDELNRIIADRVQLVAPLIKVASSNSVSSSSSSWRISSSSPVVPVVAAVANRPPLPPLIMPPIGLFSSIPSVKVVVECLDDENHDHHCDNDRDRDRDRVSSNMASLI